MLVFFPTSIKVLLNPNQAIRAVPKHSLPLMVSSKHERSATCSAAQSLRKEVLAHAEDIRGVITEEELLALSAPHGNIIYDLVTKVDREYLIQRLTILSKSYSLANKGVCTIVLPWLVPDTNPSSSHKPMSPPAEDEITMSPPTTVTIHTTAQPNPAEGTSASPTPAFSIATSAHPDNIGQKTTACEDRSLVDMVIDLVEKYGKHMRMGTGERIGNQASRILAQGLPEHVLRFIATVYQDRIASEGDATGIGAQTEGKGKGTAH
ncbi:hypothetical protein B9Z19DRAFT_1068650 [Tuber borchii]|uniref:Uncharacterized protein n=1 Tax=Tuber borchii TaxID=42251 RepID=A0A2T6ZEP9_TUBBO|nr:hypothetical protein B9Z19DRAFT_1068650 [Tuber borchii]